MKTVSCVLGVLCIAWGEKHVEPSDSTLLVQSRSTAGLDKTLMDQLASKFLTVGRSDIHLPEIPNRSEILKHIPGPSPFDSYTPELPVALSRDLGALGQRLADRADASLRKALSSPTRDTSFHEVLSNVSRDVKKASSDGEQSLRSLWRFQAQEMMRVPLKKHEVGWTKSDVGIQENYARPLVSFDIKSEFGLCVRMKTGTRISLMNNAWSEDREIELEDMLFIGWTFDQGSYVFIGEYIPFWVRPKLELSAFWPFMQGGFYPNPALEAKSRERFRATGGYRPPDTVKITLSVQSDGPFVGTDRVFFGPTFGWSWNWERTMNADILWRKTRNYPFKFEGTICPEDKSALKSKIEWVFVQVGCGDWFPAVGLCDMVEPLVLAPSHGFGIINR